MYSRGKPGATEWGGLLRISCLGGREMRGDRFSAFRVGGAFA